MFQIQISSRPYTSPVWQAIRGDCSAFEVVTQDHPRNCCEQTGLDRKVRVLLSRKTDEAESALSALSAVSCLERVKSSFNSKGGWDNAESERIISILGKYEHL